MLLTSKPTVQFVKGFSNELIFILLAQKAPKVLEVNVRSLKIIWPRFTGHLFYKVK